MIPKTIGSRRRTAVYADRPEKARKARMKTPRLGPKSPLRSKRTGRKEGGPSVLLNWPEARGPHTLHQQFLLFNCISWHFGAAGSLLKHRNLALIVGSAPLPSRGSNHR